MKNVFSLFVAVLITTSFLPAQDRAFNGYQCELVGQYDELIYEIDSRRDDAQETFLKFLNDPKFNGTLQIDTVYLKEFLLDTSLISNDPANIKYYISDKHNIIRKIIADALFPALQIGRPEFDPEIFKARLDCIRHVETITWLEFVLELSITGMETTSDLRSMAANAYSGPSGLKSAHQIVKKRIDELMDGTFSMYRFTETSKKPIKSIYIEHANDVFSFHNNDRDLTGAFRIEIATDLFKMRVFSSFSDKWWNLNSRSWYSYQTIFLGGEGYTPYLRDTSIFKRPDSFDPDDRPYASFQYFGRAKHRIYRHGQFRMFSQFKIGSIGSATPDNIQSTIHRDITIGSYKPQGWKAQIAAGGRIAAHFEVVPELMLLSKNWLVSRKWSDVSDIKGWKWLNLSALAEIKIGHEMTSFGAGLNFSNRNFKQSGGIHIPFVNADPRSFGGFLKKTTFNVRALYRYVRHNSMLEGFGVFKRTADEDPTSPTDVWYLRRDLGQINPHIFVLDLTVTFRLKYCGLLLRQQFMSPEFNMPVNTKQYPFGEGDFPGNHNTSPWNHVGTIGLIFRV